MKKAIIFCVLCLTLTVPAFAYNYQFETGADTSPGFGTPTSTDRIVHSDPTTTNNRRNKDAAFLPPPFGVFSGYIPTDQSSLFHNNLPESGFVPMNQHLPFLPATSQTAATNTLPLFYEDGSIGTLIVHKLNRTITVFPGETQESMRNGAGHFSFTSAWDGNVALASHNRGASSHFSFVRDLQMGDRITYTTRYGTRTYEVFSKEQINELDRSVLGWSAENILTLITCVENRPELRWAAQLREVR